MVAQLLYSLEFAYVGWLLGRLVIYQKFQMCLVDKYDYDDDQLRWMLAVDDDG